MSSPKHQEAEECIRQAEKCLKTSLLKWQPDFDGAADQYQKAATCYKTVKDFQKCIDCNIKAAEMFRQNKSYYMAAKSYEQVAMMAGKDLNKWDMATANIEKACGMYREHGVPDTAALCLDRGAKMIESQNPSKAAEFYSVAADICMIEGKTFQGAEFAGKAARMHMKLKNLDAATEMLNKQFQLMMETGDERQCGRIVVCQVILQLARDDYVAAKKAYLDGQVYVEQQEICTLSMLLDAWDSTDLKKVVSALNHPFIKALDNEIAKLVRTIQQRHGLGGSSNQEQDFDEEPTEESEAAALM